MYACLWLIRNHIYIFYYMYIKYVNIKKELTLWLGWIKPYSLPKFSIIKCIFILHFWLRRVHTLISIWFPPVQGMHVDMFDDKCMPCLNEQVWRHISLWLCPFWTFGFSLCSWQWIYILSFISKPSLQVWSQGWLLHSGIINKNTVKLEFLLSFCGCDYNCKKVHTCLEETRQIRVDDKYSITFAALYNL